MAFCNSKMQVFSITTKMLPSLEFLPASSDLSCFFISLEGIRIGRGLAYVMMGEVSGESRDGSTIWHFCMSIDANASTLPSNTQILNSAVVKDGDVLGTTSSYSS